MMLQIEQIKKGDTFWECESGFNDEFIALCDAHQKNDGWTLTAEPASGGDPIEFFARIGTPSCYHPRLYTTAQYI